MRRVFLAVVLLGAVGCGDPDTNDKRGYTKAPLESPNVLVKGERASAMAALGSPNLPVAPVIAAEEQKKDSAAAGTGQGTTTPKAGTPPSGATAADVSEGQKIFSGAGNCFTCHGANGGGTGLAPSLADNEWLNVSGDYPSLQQVINAGVAQPKKHAAPMPPRGGAALTDAQVKQVAAYVYSLSH